MYSVYALVDPRDDTIRYIGMSKNVWRRYAMHLLIPSKGAASKTAWIKRLKEIDLAPLLTILETAETEEDALKRETYWIKHYLKQDTPLLNVAKTGIRRFIEPKEGWGFLLEEFRKEYPPK